MERATELDYLRWFYLNADWGLEHEEMMAYLEAAFMEETGKELPFGYSPEDPEAGPNADESLPF